MSEEIKTRIHEMFFPLDFDKKIPEVPEPEKTFLINYLRGKVPVNENSNARAIESLDRYETHQRAIPIPNRKAIPPGSIKDVSLDGATVKFDYSDDLLARIKSIDYRHRDYHADKKQWLIRPVRAEDNTIVPEAIRLLIALVNLGFDISQRDYKSLLTLKELIHDFGD